MTARFHSRGRDRWAHPGNQTVWQRERSRAPGRLERAAKAKPPLLPMEQPRRSLWRRLFGR